MQNVMGAWSALETRKQITLVLSVIAMVVTLFWLTTLATAPRMTLLYAGLEPAAASEVVAALDQQGIAHDVRGDAVYVSSADRDALRISLAGQGLPANGMAGYELLDSLSGFGTTSQMFDAAYWRAKEGELARTISASPQVRAARVHIATPSSEPFRRDAMPTASVFVTPASGQLGPDQAQALKYLVAAAVSRLVPEHVSVIDSHSGTVIDATMQAPRAADEERAVSLQRSVTRLLEARVGPGRAVVEVSVEPETDRESIVERRFDPEGRVAISTETEERTSSSRGTNGGGEVTVASDLPDGDANTSGGESSAQDSETRERTNFEVSETQREILREPGGIRRLSVAVLVDGTREIGPDGTEVWTPRSDEELADLRDLVASAVGFDADRGDEITIKSLAFEALPEAETGTGAAGAFPVDPMALAQLALLGAVALALGLFVVRPILASTQAAALPAPESEADIPPPPALTGEIDDGTFAPPAMNTVPDFDMNFGGDGDGLPGGDDPVSRLKSLISERQDETMEILRGWMNDSKERAG